VEKYHKILELKCIFDIDDYKILLPNEIIKMFKYVKNLKFEEAPNYSMIKNSFKSILYNIGHTENEAFSWIKDKRFLNSKVSPNVTIRKKSLKKRIFDKLNQYQIDKSSIANFSRKNMTESSLSQNIIDLENLKPLQKSNYFVFTLPSKGNNFKTNEYSTTPDNSNIYSLRKLNQTSKNKPIKLNKAVLKTIKVGNSINLKNNIKIQLNNEFLPKKNLFKLNTFDSRKNKSKSEINHNSYIKIENARNYFSIYKINSNLNNLNLSQKYSLLNKRKNNSNINSNTNRSIIIPPNFLVNNVNSRNKVNKYLFIKKDGILKRNDDKKYIINNTFINNYNNSNIININNNKSQMKKNDLNLCVSVKNENIEGKNKIVNKSNIKDTYFNFYINK
jgi:hypothetical protein